jgi:hypothetical protein
MDSGFTFCNTTIKLIDCLDNNIFYYVNSPLSFSGLIITSGDTINVNIDGENKCVTVDEFIDGSATNFVIQVNAIYPDCDVCIPTPTPTPTPTQTVTPTVTLTPTTSLIPPNIVYVYTGCNTNQMVILTEPLSNVTQGESFRPSNDINSCWSYVGPFDSPYTPPTGWVYNTFNYNYFGSVSGEYIYSDCFRCNISLT